MITNISLTTIYCLDQEKALDFYTDVLGFVARDDVSMGDGFRWVTVSHPDHPEMQITLMKPGPPLDAEAADFHRRLGDFSAAEDLVQDAVETALKRWPVEGIPERPDAGLAGVEERGGRADGRARLGRAATQEAAVADPPRKSANDGLPPVTFERQMIEKRQASTALPRAAVA